MSAFTPYDEEDDMTMSIMMMMPMKIMMTATESCSENPCATNVAYLHIHTAADRMKSEMWNSAQTCQKSKWLKILKS